MKSTRVSRRGALLGLAAVSALAAGCATPPAPRAPRHEVDTWSGRLAVTVDSNPPQQFSAGFDLAGNERQGSLRLNSPLGSTIAFLRWEPGYAVLEQGDKRQSFDSLDALTRAATGVALPLAALFAWLHGVDATAPGWQADLRDAHRGRLSAERLDPLPRASLRVILARP